MNVKYCKGCEFYEPIEGRVFGNCHEPNRNMPVFKGNCECIVMCCKWIPVIKDGYINMDALVPMTEDNMKAYNDAIGKTIVQLNIINNDDHRDDSNRYELPDNY